MLFHPENITFFYDGLVDYFIARLPHGIKVSRQMKCVNRIYNKSCSNYSCEKI